MTAALDNRLIMHNPCRGVAIPQGSSGTHRAITQDEIDLILSVARDGHRFSLPVLLMLFAGLRRGEAAGLNASDIKGNEIHINRSIYWTHNRPNIDTPKTNAGIRIVPVFPPLEPFLKFTGYAAKSFNSTPTQGPITLQSFERGYESFMRACEEKMNGFSKQKKPADYDWKRLDIRTHDLRHTFVTMLYDAGVDLKTAQRWLGHADPSVTLKIYTHLTDAKHSAAASNASEYISQITGSVL